MVRVWLATSPVDMRRAFDRLAEHVRTILAGIRSAGICLSSATARLSG